MPNGCRLVLLCACFTKTPISRGAWVAQSVKHSAHVMISWLMHSSPESGSVPTARSLEPASDAVSVSLSAPPPLMRVLSLSLPLSLSLSNINKIKQKEQPFLVRKQNPSRPWNYCWEFQLRNTEFKARFPETLVKINTNWRLISPAQATEELRTQMPSFRGSVGSPHILEASPCATFQRQSGIVVT